MTFFYTIALKAYYLIISIFALFNLKAKQWIDGRKNLLNRLKDEIVPGEPVAWFHCASLGEFEQGRPVIEAYKKKYTDHKILLTFFSPSGYEIRKNYEFADYVYYLPIDTPRNAKQFIDIVNPRIVFFIKYEFWQCFIQEIGRREIPLYLVSGIFRKNQHFFRWYGKNARRMLNNFTHFFVQNKNSHDLLNSIELNNVSISGDTRFDRVFAIAQKAKELPLVEKFKNNSKIIIAGSSWKPDEEIIIGFFNQNSRYKLIIAPHEIHSDNISRIINAFTAKTNVLKYSDANETNIEKADVLIIDSIGMLSSLYKYGDIAYIGGGFGKGIHNTLEAATFGLPVIFGPNYQKFQEALDLLKQQAAFAISSATDYEDIILKLLDDYDFILQSGNRSANYVKQHCGATNLILDKLS